ncbi:hypothetical protein SAMN04515674_110188 [Pseudarcicella hirudinis]|uniref:Uncharacterized protein n=1 Tax=Pseudarcicella hirudinis TaxID=1079859 RepID=A0A1I5W2Y6_9BACT|nr:hypothetical protein [Pseudarcicella hirudinis]SFQ13626.1 hypothetical protein SAMN04515674_110188 [Pseudarcicella hirudinis]
MALITKKKIPFRINNQLRKYLMKYNREFPLPIQYEDLKRFENTISLYDKKGNDTLWETVFYSPSEIEEIYEALKTIYADLKTDGDEKVIKHLTVDRVDICSYGNTQPFRIRIVNRVNDNFDYFYIKRADASRVYGLELEHILSPNRISYITNRETLIEEHIAGIPGDQFFKSNLTAPDLNPIRLAKEFIKFNERCFVQLLGDMHSSNFVIVTTPDFEETYYRIRAIDFDQQSYEAKRSVYMPQYFKQNNPLIELGMKYMTPESVKQYQYEERALMSGRLRVESQRTYDLMDVMAKDEISLPENIDQLRKELADFYGDKKFLKCKTMGEIVWTSLELVMMH